MENIDQRPPISEDVIKYKKAIKISIGVFICLLSIFGAINYGIVSEYLTWGISFLFGGYFSYVIYLFLFLIGICIIFSKKKRKYKVKLLVTGLILMLLGSIIIFTNFVTTVDNETYLNFNSPTFVDDILNGVSYGENIPQIDYSTNCGIIGIVIVSLINPYLTYVGSYIIGAVIAFLGLLIISYKLLKKLFKKILSREYNFIVKEEPVISSKELEEKNLLIDTEPAFNVVNKKKQPKQTIEHMSSTDTIKRTATNEYFDQSLYASNTPHNEQSNLKKVDVESSIQSERTYFEKAKNTNSDLKKAIYDSSIYNDKIEKSNLNQNSSFNSKEDMMYDAVKSYAMSKEYFSIQMIMNSFNVHQSFANEMFNRLQKDGIVDMTKDKLNGRDEYKVLIHSSYYSNN